MGWEFSSLGRLEASESAQEALNLKAGLMPDFKTNILPKETLTIPTAFIGCYQGDIDEGASRLHKFILEKLGANPAKSFADPTTVLGLYLDAGADQAKEADVLRCLKFAKGLDLDT